MLAEALVRLNRGKPTRRYALDPLHQQAIQNYLSLLTRGYGMPQLHRQAQPQIGQALGRQAPLFNEILGALFQQHDPAAPGAALDLYRDHAGDVPGENDDLYMHGEQGNELPDLLNRLLGAHHGLSGGLDIPGMFHPEQLRSRPIRSFLDSALGYNTPTLQPYTDIPESLGQVARVFPQHAPRARELRDRVLTGNEREGIPFLTETHDLGHPLVGNRNLTGSGHARRLRDHSSMLLMQAFHHLTGQVPLEGNNG